MLSKLALKQAAAAAAAVVNTSMPAAAVQQQQMIRVNSLLVAGPLGVSSASTVPFAFRAIR
jgi:hypothetical protein